MRQERGNQLLEISLTSLPQLDVHKILSEISRKAPNIEKLRLVRIGTRTAASTKGNLETASAEPGKLMRFASVKQILLAECYRLEFLRIWVR